MQELESAVIHTQCNSINCAVFSILCMVHTAIMAIMAVLAIMWLHSTMHPIPQKQTALHIAYCSAAGASCQVLLCANCKTSGHITWCVIACAAQTRCVCTTAQ